jgi:A/G-specific adenine glycosylase
MLKTKDVSALIAWYRKAKRDLPWRKTGEAYDVWVSEIMLQQTRVEAVKPYYLNFMSKYPTVSDLASAKEEDLNRIWEGLGYYSRVRNMHKAAKEVEASFGGLFPVTFDALITLPGIGEYTAGAVSSIAGGENVPAVDGNVLRVYSRVEALKDSVSEASVVKEIRKSLQNVMDKAKKEDDAFSPGDFNSAMMELGATVCLPKGAPKCEECPFSKVCKAKKEGKCEEYPVKTAKLKRKVEQKTIFILHSLEGIGLHKRPDKGLLAGLYEFPSVPGHLSRKEALEYIKSLGYHPLKCKRIEDAKHIFSHVEWQMRGYFAELDAITDPAKHDPENEVVFVTAEERKSAYALPSAFSAYKKYIV